MKYLYLLFIGLFLVECKTIECCGPIRDGTPLHFQYQSAEGKDLLNPQTPGYFSKENILLFYLIKGRLIQYVDDPEAGNRIAILNDGKNYILNLAPSEHIVDDLSKTYLNFDKKFTDSITCKFNSQDNLLIEKVWYNDSLIYEGKSVETKTFVIKK